MGKGIVIGLIIGALVVYLALSQNAPEEAPSAANLSEAPEYVANKAVVEAMFAAFTAEDLDTWSGVVADSVKWTTPAYGAELDGGTKDDWRALLQGYNDGFDDVTMQQSFWLPGLDEYTSEPDGSVRLYVHWKGTHTESGVVAEPWYYANFELEDGKITRASEYMDVGGMMNHIAAAAAGN